MAKIGEDRKGEVEKFMLNFTWSNNVTRYFISLQCSGHSILWRFYRVCCSWQGCGSKVSVSCLMLNQRFIPIGVERISTDVRAVCFVWFCACSVQHLALLQKRVGYAVNQVKHKRCWFLLTNQVAKPGNTSRVVGRVIFPALAIGFKFSRAKPRFHVCHVFPWLPPTAFCHSSWLASYRDRLVHLLGLVSRPKFWTALFANSS